jgi:hypothetical protein
LKFAELAEIFFSQKTIAKDHGFIRVPDSVRIVESKVPGELVEP